MIDGAKIPMTTGVLVAVGVALAVSFSGPDVMADMTDSEKSSYPAVYRYIKCLGSVVDRVKANGATPSDAEIERLGYACPAELDDAARKLAARMDYRSDDVVFRRLPMAKRIEIIRSDLAADAYCRFRQCDVM